jgi:predicted nuclease of predicted toxin-antitoxin system
VRFLLDQNLSPQLVAELMVFGHDVVHVRDLGMSRSTDAEILQLAHREARIIVSSDTDLGSCLRAPMPRFRRSCCFADRVNAGRPETS